MARQMRGIVFSLVNAVLYQIRQARNMLIFEEKASGTKEIVNAINEQITQRALQPQHHKKNYTKCIDYLMHRSCGRTINDR